jgi:hypothetical protein
MVKKLNLKGSDETARELLQIKKGAPIKQGPM